MNAPANSPAAESPKLCDIAIAAIAGTRLRGNESLPLPEDAILRRTAEFVSESGRSLHSILVDTLEAPADEDRALVELARTWSLDPRETLAVALAVGVERDALVGRVLAHVQAPLGGSRPTLGLLAYVFDGLFEAPNSTLPRLVNGAAVRNGLLVLLNDAAPLPERALMVPAVLSLALAGHDGTWAGTGVGERGPDVPLPESVLTETRRQARALKASPHRTLVLRTGSTSEGRAVAAAVARALELRPLFIETDKLTGLGAWLRLRKLVPVYCLDLPPGERRTLADIAGYDGPVLIVTGPDGAIEPATGSAVSWVLTVPTETERTALWFDVVHEEKLAQQLARDFRHGAGRIAHLGRLAQHQAAIAQPPGEPLATTETSAGPAPTEPQPGVRRDDVVAAAWGGEGSGLDALAEPLRTRVPKTALVMTQALNDELDALLLRCRVRDGLSGGLGESATTRYRPGVRALFTGPSGTGKTLAAGWIATSLGLPLYRVDLASVTSKYIGETEKNLSLLLARAEQAEVVLLFDEADSLFGKRTDISDANDRFANAQTNYLLQRIENYDGIVVLTSNSQARFDTAFARRLDFVIEFPAPDPDERRKLWVSHLGDNAELNPAQLNQLAALADLSGGHIRNAVLTAAARARASASERKIAYRDVVNGIESEFKKLGRQMPVALTSSS